MVNRIGATTAAVRRSIDRLWQDQSIETCDDWVIPSSRRCLIRNSSLASTRAGSGSTSQTPSTIGTGRAHWPCSEQIASDITRLGRQGGGVLPPPRPTRHRSIRPFGPPAAAGSATRATADRRRPGWTLTGAPIGGFADLRNAYGTALSAARSTSSSTPPTCAPGKGSSVGTRSRIWASSCGGWSACRSGRSRQRRC